MPIQLPSIEALPSADGDPVTGEVPEDILAAIVADAAERMGVGEDEITITRGEAVTWNDGALGCPEPGMFYTQAHVDGYHIVLETAGDTLDYRADSAGRFRICTNPSRPSG